MSSLATGPSVLVVDDDIMICKTLARLLSRSGYPAMCIESGEMALDYLATCQPSLVFLDVMMPGMSGFEVLRQIRSHEKCKHVVVLMYTALSDTENIRQAMELGANDYIIKGSMTFEQIQSIVEKHVDHIQP